MKNKYEQKFFVFNLTCEKLKFKCSLGLKKNLETNYRKKKY